MSPLRAEPRVSVRPEVAQPTRARAKRGPDAARVERARLALRLSAGNVRKASRCSHVPRRTIRRWITAGHFDQDEWEGIRQERAREAIELAYDGLRRGLLDLTTLDVARDGAMAVAQAVRTQLEVIRLFGGKTLDIGQPRALDVHIVVVGRDGTARPWPERHVE